MNVDHGGSKSRMKQITVTETKRKLTNSDIKLLEEKLGVTLPEDYKNFLLLHPKLPRRWAV
jgi:cell wall assembly regulator SMI1